MKQFKKTMMKTVKDGLFVFGNHCKESRRSVKGIGPDLLKAV